MSNLRLIDDTTATSVASVSVTDIFSSDYDIYKILLLQKTSAGNSLNIRFINSSGSIITASNYDRALLQLRSSGTSSVENISQNVGQMNMTFQGTEDFVTTFYIFNPFSTSSYTFALSQSAGYYGGAGIENLNVKAIGVLKQTTSCSGIFFAPSSGNFTDVSVKTYGLRVDS